MYNTAMKRILILTLILLSIIILPLTAQSNEVMDGFLEKEAADAGTALLLIAQARGELPDSATTDDAIKWCADQSWGKKLRKLEADDSINTGQFHIALFRSFDIKGGMIFGLFKTPRAAAQEAGYQGYISGTPYVNHKMTPNEVLDSLSMALDAGEEEK